MALTMAKRIKERVQNERITAHKIRIEEKNLLTREHGFKNEEVAAFAPSYKKIAPDLDKKIIKFRSNRSTLNLTDKFMLTSNGLCKFQILNSKNKAR
jgi:hypothetical protein